MNFELWIMEAREKIRSFTDLDAWKEAYKLTLELYKLTKQFPKEELFALVIQLRRAVISITSNIAEGFSRQSYKEKVQFYSISLGSLSEVQNQLYVSKGLNYITQKDFDTIAQQTIVVSKLLNGLLKGARGIIQNS